MQNEPNSNTNDGWQRLAEGQAMDTPQQQPPSIKHQESTILNMQNEPNFKITRIEYQASRIEHRVSSIKILQNKPNLNHRETSDDATPYTTKTYGKT
jgi:hypothetical protein